MTDLGTERQHYRSCARYSGIPRSSRRTLAGLNLTELEVAKRNQVSEKEPSPLNNVFTIDDERIKNHLDWVVRGSVEERLNALLLEAGADRLCNAQQAARPSVSRLSVISYSEQRVPFQTRCRALSCPRPAGLRAFPGPTQMLWMIRVQAQLTSTSV
jgi:hypothetical protein